MESIQIDLFFMSRLAVDSISWKNTPLGSVGKPRIVVENYEIRKKQHLTEHLADKYRGESDGVHGRVLAADSLYFFMAAQARKLSLSASLEWAR